VGSYHWRAGSRFITVDDLDTKPWIGRDRDSTFTGLRAAYDTARRLHDDGLELVVAPIPARDRSIAVRLDPQYSIAMFPFVDGRAGEWGESITSDERVRLLRGLAELHTATPNAGSPIARRAHVLPERDALLAALADLHRPWAGGDFSEQARAAVSKNASSIRSRLARFDELAAQLDAADRRIVVTHGEPHPGNLIHAADGLRLIDWDTVALAEPERDLWMLDDGPNALDVYVDATGHEVDRAAIEFYGLAWTMSDIASFTDMFRRPHERTRWAEHKWTGFAELLEGAFSAPYASG